MGSVNMIRNAMVVTNFSSLSTETLLDPMAMSIAFWSTLPLLLTALLITILGKVSGMKQRKKENAPPMMMLM